MARILIIEDDAQTRRTIRRVLEGARHEVVEARNGEVAISLYREEPADLVITDMIMPEIDGAATIAILRQDYPDVKIIAISGGGRIGSDAYLYAAENLGALRALPKPFGKSELLAAVHEVLAWRASFLRSVSLMIVGVLAKMNDNVFDAVHGLGVEKVKGVVGGGKMTIHTVSHKALSIVHMGWNLPGMVGKPDLMAPRTKLGCRCADHGVVGEAEKGEGYDQTDADENGGLTSLLMFPSRR
jgi:CheY-like chemotaxis protein